MKRKHQIQLVIGAILSIGAIYVSVQGVKLSELLEAFKSFRHGYIIPCMAMFYFGVFLRALRWRWLFLPKHNVPLRHAMSGVFICFGFNSVFPFRAGEFARAYLIGKRDNTGFSTAFGTVVAERLLDVLVLLICMVAALAVAPVKPDASFSMLIFGEDITITGSEFHKVKNGFVLLSALLTVGIALIAIPRSRAWCLSILGMMRFIPVGLREKGEELVHRFADGLGSFGSPKRVVALFAISLLVWATNAASVMILAWGFDFETKMTLSQAFALIVIVCVFIVPATPGYWGLFEVGVVFSIMMIGIHSGKALALSYAIALHLTQWLPFVLIGLPLAWVSHVSLDDAKSAAETT